LGDGDAWKALEMPLTNPPPSSGFAGPVGFYGVTPIGQPTGYVWNYVTQNKTLSAYAANVQSSAYVGGLLDLLQAARLADLNTLRVSVENQRVFTEAIAQQHNQLCQDLKAMGIIAA
jgi:hypothetical protein